MRKRDEQVSKVYAWEDTFVYPLNKWSIAYKDAQTFVDLLWAQEGLMYPPAIVPMPKQNRTAEAKADRGRIFIQEKVRAITLIHELAHSMTATECSYDIGSHSDRHNADFMGIYLKLLEKYLNISLLYTQAKLQGTGIKYNLAATPYCTRP